MLTGYQIVNCPNCGGLAERQYFKSADKSTDASVDCSHDAVDAEKQVVMQTRCRACDYSMTLCLSSGAVLESYAPGLRADCSETLAAHCTI